MYTSDGKIFLMKLISWNVNGLRSVSKKGFDLWFNQVNADIVCLQEIKLQEKQFLGNLANHIGYFSYLNCAQKKGYSGVAVFTKEKPLSMETKLGLDRFDNEGRIMRLDYENFVLLNLYLPHGARDKSNLAYKLLAYQYLFKYLENLKKKKIILIGDFNIAHKDLDLARPKENQKNTMFTSNERRQLDKLIDLGFIDTFRYFHQEVGNYTWWPYFANARQRNLGWRIDYSFISKNLTPQLKKAFILPKVLGSDHCPIGIEI